MNKQTQHKAIVKLNLEGETNELGTLAYHESKIYFKLSEIYLNNFAPFMHNKLLVSPFKINHSKEIQTSQPLPFEGLFGLFADSLPDGWGRLLLDRFLKSKNKNTAEATPLSRLLYVGKNGAGALEYEPELENYQHNTTTIDVDTYNTAAKKILLGENDEILADFYRLGGTSGGARPKINVGLNSQTNHLIEGNNVLPSEYEHWIIKFSSTFDYVDTANIEYAYYKMALNCGIEMSESKLLKGKGNAFFFATKRFDRVGNHKIHLHSLAGLLHDDFKASVLDYGHLLDAAFQLEKDVTVYQKILRLAAFNVFASNQDDHSKNFSFLMNKKGKWRFAPAYDLTFSPSNYGFQSLSVAKANQNITAKDLLNLAKHFQIENANNIIQEVKETLSDWNFFAKEAEVSKNSINLIQKTIDEKIKA